MPTTTKPADAELLAIEACLEALRPLSDEARHRALSYVTERLAAEVKANGNGNGNGKRK